MTEKNLFKAESVFSIMGAGTIVAGKLDSGLIKKGMRAIINGKTAEVLRIESDKKIVDSLTPGVPAGLILNGVDKKDIVVGQDYLFN